MCSIFSAHLRGGPKWKWRQWSFEDWKRQGQTSLNQHSVEQPGLFIVDLQNRDKTATVNGRSILHQIATSGLPREALHVMVLTGECEQQDEFRVGRELTRDFFDSSPLQLPVFVMAKERLAQINGDKLNSMKSSFVDLLSRVATSAHHRHLKSLLSNVFVKAIDATFQSLERFTIEEFMYAVTHRSVVEGVPEIDTLIRIVGIEQRRQLQRAIIENDDVQKVLTRIRSSKVCLDKKQLESDDEIKSLRNAELYDPAEVVNRLRSPVCAGDLFAVTGTSEREGMNVFCLVGNFCDITLRDDGTRKARIGLLLPLRKLNPGNHDSRLKYMLEKLPACLSSNFDGVSLNSFLSVDFEVLDLCWSNDKGACRWSASGNQNGRLPRLSSAQEARLRHLDKYFRDGVDKTPLLALQTSLGSCIRYRPKEERRKKYEKKSIARRVQTTQGVLTALSFIDFGIQRIGRLSHSHATHLVAEFADALGRPSRLHDFSGID